MSDAVETIDYKGHTINIYHDDSDMSPREWDNMCIIHIGHRRYAFGDKNYSTIKPFTEALKEARRNGDICLPIYMYDHSGITISLDNTKYPYNCRWDSCQCGFIQIPRKKMMEEFGKKIFTKALKEKGLELAKGEIETLDSRVRGEVYGYKVDEDTDDEDSCWGFIGDIKYVIEEAKSIIDHMVKTEKVEA